MSLEQEYYPELEHRRMDPALRTLLIFLVIGAVLNIFAVHRVHSSIWIYTGEMARDWDCAARMAAASSPAELWQTIAASVADGTGLSPFLPGMIMKIFSSSRLVFVLSLVNLYVLPLLIVLYLLASKLHTGKTAAAISSMLMFPVIYYAALSGISAVGGLIFCFLCLYMHIGKREKSLLPKKKQKEPLRPRLILGTGLSLAAASLFDPTYLYFSIGFLITFLGEGAFMKKSIKNPLWTFALWIITALLPLASWIAKTQLSADFHLGNTGGLIYIGAAVPVLLGIFSIAAFIRERDMRLVILWIQLAVCFSMSASTAAGGIHCILTFIPSLCALALILFSGLDGIRSSRLSQAAPAIVLIASSLVSAATLLPVDTFYLLPSFSLRPLYMENVQNIAAVANYLNTTVEPGMTVGILAAPDDLSSDLLYHAEPSLGGAPDPEKDFYHPLPFSSTESADLSPLYTVNYIVFASPVQYSGGEQDLLREAAISFENYADIAIAYEAADDRVFDIGDGITARVLRRVREPSEQEIIDFTQRLYREES